MNEQFLLDVINNVKKIQETNMPEWKIDLMAARTEIIVKLLSASYYALGLTLPCDDVLQIRSAQIAEKADVCDRQLKEAFCKALDIKMEKDLRTPITYGDITRAARMVAEENNSTIQGKWKLALPSLEDSELWGESVCLFAAKHGRAELESMRALTYGR